MLELKSISREAIPRALEKADRYRFLNEPSEAESICLDILESDPENQRAVVVLILALTDQFSHSGFTVSESRAQELLPRIKGEYERAYYAGVICERRGKAILEGKTTVAYAGSAAYEWFDEAMGWYAKAEGIRPAGNDDAVLRWNTCARILNRNTNLQPRGEDTSAPYLE